MPCFSFANSQGYSIRQTGARSVVCRQFYSRATLLIGVYLCIGTLTCYSQDEVSVGGGSGAESITQDDTGRHIAFQQYRYSLLLDEYRLSSYSQLSLREYRYQADGLDLEMLIRDPEKAKLAMSPSYRRYMREKETREFLTWLAGFAIVGTHDITSGNYIDNDGDYNPPPMNGSTRAVSSRKSSR